MKKFRLYWLDGKTEVIEGNSIEDAFRRAGYGGGALRALDFYDDGEELKYKWNSTNRTWESIPKKTQYQAGSIGGF